MANVPTTTNEIGQKVAATPVRIVTGKSALNEAGQTVESIPISIITGTAATPPIVQLSTLITTSETGAAIGVQPARIVAGATTTDSLGNAVPVIQVRDIGPTPISISGTPAAATVGVAYSFTPTTANGSGTKSFAYSGTSLASFGLSFSTSTGAITGTVSGSAGTITGTITVTDSSGSADLPISIAVSAAATAFSFTDNFDSGADNATVARRPGWAVRSDDSRLYPFVKSQGIVQNDGFSPANNGFAGVDLGRVDGGYVQAKFVGASVSGNGPGFFYDKNNWVRLVFLSATRFQIVECVAGTTTTRFDTGVNLSTAVVTGDIFRLVLTYSGGLPRLTIQRNGVNFPQQSNYSSGTAPTFPLTTLTLTLSLGLAGFIGSAQSASTPNWDDFAAGHNGSTPLPRMTMKSGRLYQRAAATGMRSIPVGGDAAGITGVEMRLLQNGTVVSGWDWGQKPLTNVSIAAGKWFADTAQVPGGDFYVVECRATNDNNALCRTRTFAVGAIFIPGGQSNGTGLANAGPVAGSSLASPAGGYAAGGPLASSVGGNDVGAYIFPPDVQFNSPTQSSLTGSFAGAIQVGLRAGSPDVPTMTVPFGLGSSNLARFMPSSTDHAAVVGTMSLWEGLMSQLNALHDPTGRDTTTVDYEGIIWLQGEEDAGRNLAIASFDATAESAYRSNMLSYYGSHKTATGRTAAQIPFVMIGLNRLYTASSAAQAVSPGWTRFRAMQWDMCDPTSAGYIPGFFYAGSLMDIPLQDTGTAQPHYGTGGIEKSHRAGYTMARAKGWAAKDRRGAIPLSAVASGNTIAVTFDLQMATGLTCSASVASQYLFATSNAIDATTNLLVAANQVVPTAMSIGTPSGGQCVVTYTFATAPAPGWAMQLYGGANPQNVVGKDPNALYSVMATDAGNGVNVLSVGAFYPLIATS